MSTILETEETESPKGFTYTQVPVCGGNLESPVDDQARYIDEIRYWIGDRQYIENAD